MAATVRQKSKMDCLLVGLMLLLPSQSRSWSGTRARCRRGNTNSSRLNGIDARPCGDEEHRAVLARKAQVGRLLRHVDPHDRLGGRAVYQHGVSRDVHIALGIKLHAIGTVGDEQRLVSKRVVVVHCVAVCPTGPLVGHIERLAVPVHLLEPAEAAGGHPWRHPIHYRYLARLLPFFEPLMGDKTGAQKTDSCRCKLVAEINASERSLLCCLFHRRRSRFS